MSSDSYQGSYLGFTVDGCKLGQLGENIAWQYRVSDRELNLIFLLSIKVSFNVLAEKRIDPEEKSTYVRMEGLKRVQSRLLLNRFKTGTEYVHTILTTGEVIDPTEHTTEPPFTNNEEKLTYYLLKTLRWMRMTLLPDTYQNAEIEINGLCDLLEVPYNAGIATIRILGDRGFIEGIEISSDDEYGIFEYMILIITPEGLDKLTELENIVRRRIIEARPNSVEHAFIVMGILHVSGATSAGSSITSNEVYQHSGLSTEEFDQIEDNLLTSELIDIKVDDPDGSWWLTPAGISCYNELKEERLPLSMDALLVARIIAEKTSDPIKTFVSENEILEVLQLDDARYRIACKELADRDLLSDKRISDTTPFVAVALTPRGRNAYRDGFLKVSAIAFQQNIGAVFQESVIDSNIQAIAIAANSKIEMAITQGDETHLRNEISDLIVQLVDQIKNELDLGQLSVYSTAAQELKEEIKKPNPNPTIINRLLGILEFVGNLDGNIELGIKGLALAVKYGPLLITLKQAILQLIQ